MNNIETRNYWTLATFSPTEILQEKEGKLSLTEEILGKISLEWRALGEPDKFKLEKFHEEYLVEISFDWVLTRPVRFIKITNIPEEWVKFVKDPHQAGDKVK